LIVVTSVSTGLAGCWATTFTPIARTKNKQQTRFIECTPGFQLQERMRTTNAKSRACLLVVTAPTVIYRNIGPRQPFPTALRQEKQKLPKVPTSRTKLT
jgi:hypothetical protein